MAAKQTYRLDVPAWCTVRVEAESREAAIEMILQAGDQDGCIQLEIGEQTLEGGLELSPVASLWFCRREADKEYFAEYSPKDIELEE